MTELTAEEVRQLLDYDPSTGELRWKVSRGRAKAGGIAGSKTSQGYREITVNRQRFFVHRLIWLMTHGRLPKEELDHINGQRSDNRLENLRECSRVENLQNLRGKRRNAKTPYMGVIKNSKGRKGQPRWSAAIRVNKKRIYIGSFDTPEEAHEAYLNKKRELHRFNTL